LAFGGFLLFEGLVTAALVAREGYSVVDVLITFPIIALAGLVGILLSFRFMGDGDE